MKTSFVYCFSAMLFFSACKKDDHHCNTPEQPTYPISTSYAGNGVSAHYCSNEGTRHPFAGPINIVLRSEDTLFIDSFNWTLVWESTTAAGTKYSDRNSKVCYLIPPDSISFFSFRMWGSPSADYPCDMQVDTVMFSGNKE